MHDVPRALAHAPVADETMSELGLTVYRTALDLPDPSAGDLARLLAVDLEVVHGELDRLARVGLVEEDGGRITCLPPRFPLDRLAAAHAKAIDDLQGAAASLNEAWDRARSVHGFIEIVNDEEKAVAAERKLMDEATTSAEGLSVGPIKRERHPVAEPTVFPGFLEAIARGVQMRGVYGVSLLEDPNGLRAVQDCIAAGEEARVFARVPMNVIVFDRRVAVVNVPGVGTARRTLLVVHQSGLLESLAALFDTFWQMSVPISGTSEVAPRADGPSDDERLLLSYLAAGMTDESIARDLGVSSRTVRRRLERLHEVLGAHSRFQLAIQASRRGWL